MTQLIELPQLEDLANKAFDPFAMDRLASGDFDDPYPVLHALMAEGPVYKGSYRKLFSKVPDVQNGDLPQYTILGHDACMQVLLAPETFTNHEAFERTLGQSFGNTVTLMDGAIHGRYRKVFQKAFLPQIVRKWGESIVDPVVDRLIGAFIDRGKADLIEEFTHHFPFQVIYGQLELDPEQAPVFHKLAVAQLLSGIGAPQGAEATAKLGAFFEELLALRRANPGTDLISHLATVEADGDRLPDDVLISFLRQLVNAGGDTTYRGSSVLLTCLLNHPDQFEAVRNDRSLIPQAVEEALRWDGPVANTARFAIRDAEVAGVPIPAGTLLNICLASANRDPAKFDEPDRFDIFRARHNRAIPFASGPHVCIGQHLARVEMTRALEAILDRLPNVRLDEDMPPPKIIGHMLRAPEHLYVKFDR